MNKNLFIDSSFEIPSLNTDIPYRTVTGRDGFVEEEKTVKGYEFDIKIHYINYDKLEYQDIINDIVTHLNTDHQVMLQFEGQYWYWKAKFFGEIKFQPHPRSFYTFTIKCMVPDPYKYSTESYSTISENDHLTILNRGTAKTFPVFIATATKDSTMLMLTKNDEDYFMIGEPEDAMKNTAPVSGYIYSTGNNRTMEGWTRNSVDIADSFAGGTLNGAMSAVNNEYVVSSYTPVTGWYGSGVRRSLSESLTDFDLTVAFRLYASSNQYTAGKAIAHMFDPQGRLVMAAGLIDSAPLRDARLFVALYGPDGHRTTILDYSHQMFNSTHRDTHVRIIRKGNEYVIKAWRVTDWNDYSQTDIINRVYKQTSTVREVRQAGMCLARHSRYEANLLEPKIRYFRVRKPLSPSDTDIPLIIEEGDTIEVNHEHEIVLLNGEPVTELKDFGAHYFDLGPGMSEILVEPRNSFDIEARWVDRFY